MGVNLLVSFSLRSVSHSSCERSTSCCSSAALQGMRIPRGSFSSTQAFILASLQQQTPITLVYWVNMGIFNKKPYILKWFFNSFMNEGEGIISALHHPSSLLWMKNQITVMQTKWVQVWTTLILRYKNLLPSMQ